VTVIGSARSRTVGSCELTGASAGLSIGPFLGYPLLNVNVGWSF
jgi:hypothetical protein